MVTTTVYLGLGGNVGDTSAIFQQALDQMRLLPGIANLEVSRLYLTKAVGGPPQRDYLNAVCRLETTLSPRDLSTALQTIEQSLGKVPKPKSFPRTLDIDILLYGQLFYRDEELEIPHPRWQQRLFVLAPLNDLIERLEVPISLHQTEWVDIGQKLKNFPARSTEWVRLANPTT